MIFSKTTVLSTRESAGEPKRLGQVIAVPNGRLDKVSIYLEPDSNGVTSAIVWIDVYAADGMGIPIGPSLASDSKSLTQITERGFVNFALSGVVPTICVLVLKLTGGDISNFISWRYQSAPSSGEEVLISGDGGASWTKDATRKFSYVAYSSVPGVVDIASQTVAIGPGKLTSHVDDKAALFSLSKLDRAVVSGDTVLIEFGDYAVTLVVDQSGSMTWNDHDGLRFTFLKQYIDDLETILPIGSSAVYSIVKFSSRQVGSMSISLQKDVDLTSVAGVRIVKKIGGKPANFLDGITIYEGLGQGVLDTNITPGTTFFYAAFTFDSLGNFSSVPSGDYAQATMAPVPPQGVAGFAAAEVVVPSGGNDIGDRQIALSWINPENYDYTSVTVMRKIGSISESPTDGTQVLLHAPAATTTLLDFPAGDAINGVSYSYRIFTEKSGLKCYTENARTATVVVSDVDRVWERAEAPFNVPPVGFPITTPATPSSSVLPGNGRVLVGWTPMDLISVRFQVYYNPTGYPRQVTSPTSSIPTYDGSLIYDGVGLSFVHEGLDNGQPHFYAIVALDRVGNPSQPSNPPIVRPRTGLSNVLPLPNVPSFTAEALNSTTNKVTWTLPFSGVASVTGYFGDSIRAISSVAFSDADARKITEKFQFVEDSRIVSSFDPTDVVDPSVAITFANSPSSGDPSISALITTTHSYNLLNKMKSVDLTFHTSLKVEQASTGKLIQEIITAPVKVSLVNPFEIDISNNPQQQVSTRTFNQLCSITDSPGEDFGAVPGVYARSGQSFNATINASFRGAALNGDILLAVRILDSVTKLPSTSVRLPETNDQGFALLATSATVDELIDRSGQPTGETVQKTTIDISIPPQDVPGVYTLEVTGAYLGYVQTANIDVHFEPNLNIDIDAVAFNPDGIDFQEQKAFVYFGAFDGPPEQKSPVPDNTVTEWTLTLIGGDAKKKPRPFYSLDNVPGTGVKSHTHGGVARNVFFGPGADVAPPVEPTCTQGEMYLVTVKAKSAGMTAVWYKVIELLPSVPKDLNRILLRLAEDQPDMISPSTVASDVRFADGSDTSRFEIVANPYTDSLPSTDQRSGLFFANAIINAPNNGLAPILEEGRVVSITAQFLTGSVPRRNIMIVTNLTGPTGSAGYAKATIVGGRAVFDVSLNARVVGPVLTAPLPGENSGNPVYDSSAVVFADSALILYLSASVVLEVNGRPTSFTGGGKDLSNSTPPAFISYKEPLA